ncbi:hypothetical protein HK105_201407 [Polyrhizophydium stewartii]|uniref:L27 domain-containing protein n=1 Tax=Polyrhizophydium stewartii TaxID=2732419 RepID=A0ABR4NHX0_9FUNG|nr:hypothetical protein HK105_001259 [Polyrhizophydium stewartii]
MLQSRHFAEAVELYERIAEQDPQQLAHLEHADFEQLIRCAVEDISFAPGLAPMADRRMRAEAIHGTMLRYHAKPTRAAAAHMLGLYSRIGDVDALAEYARLMEAHEIVLGNGEMEVHLMRAHLTAGNEAEALRQFEAVKQCLDPESAWASLLTAYCVAGNVLAATETLDKMVDLGVRLESKSLGLVCSLLAPKRGALLRDPSLKPLDADGARTIRKYTDILGDQQSALSGQIWSFRAAAANVLGEHDRALLFLERMVQQGLRVTQTENMEHIIALVGLGRIDEAYGVYSQAFRVTSTNVPLLAAVEALASVEPAADDAFIKRFEDRISTLVAGRLTLISAFAHAFSRRGDAPSTERLVSHGLETVYRFALSHHALVAWAHVKAGEPDRGVAYLAQQISLGTTTEVAWFMPVLAHLARHEPQRLDRVLDALKSLFPAQRVAEAEAAARRDAALPISLVLHAPPETA